MLFQQPIAHDLAAHRVSNEHRHDVARIIHQRQADRGELFLQRPRPLADACAARDPGQAASVEAQLKPGNTYLGIEIRDRGAAGYGGKMITNFEVGRGLPD